MVNLPLLWISALFYVALVSALYVLSYVITWALLRFTATRGRGALLQAQSTRKRALLSAIVLPPVLALLPTAAGATLRHMHTTGSGLLSKPAPHAVLHTTDGAPPLEHHAMACQQLFDRLTLLSGFGTAGDIGRVVNALVGGGAWLLLIVGLGLAARLVWATVHLEKGIAPFLAPPSPQLTASLDRVGRSFPRLATSRFFECAIPAALSSVLGLGKARCVLSTQFVQDAPRDELDAVVAHEASHLRSGDVYATFVVGLLNCLFFFLRPVRHLSKLWREAAELASDDVAVRATKNPLAMASAILRVSGVSTTATVTSAPPGLPAVALPFADEAACAPAKRVERLLNQAQRAALSPAVESPLQLALGWVLTAFFAAVGMGLLLSSEVACVAHCTLELVQRLL